MLAILVVIVTGVIGFSTKIVFDMLSEHKASKTLAAALAGELGAYLRLLQPQQTFESLRKIANSPYEDRGAALRGTFSLPSGHPVFDRVADKIGTLSPEAARGVSEAYNIITSGRLLLTSLSSDAFLQAPDHVQVVRMTVIADMFEPEIEGIRTTVGLLDQFSHAKFSLLARLVEITR